MTVLLVSRITVSTYLCRRIQTSFLAPYHAQANCIQATANKIVELIVYRVVHSSFHTQYGLLYTVTPFVDTKGHSPTYESGFDRTS